MDVVEDIQYVAETLVTLAYDVSPTTDLLDRASVLPALVQDLQAASIGRGRAQGENCATWLPISVSVPSDSARNSPSKASTDG
jgi:hypothetical protein